MSVTNNLKTQVDLPVWEWCAFAPIINTAVSSMTTGNTLGNRYLYFQNLGILHRYDTVANSWNQMTSMVGMNIPTIMNNNVFSNYHGHYGQAIGSGGGNNTIQLAGLSGNALVGYKIRIIDGTGAGQERTITAVAAPVVVDRGEVTTAGTQNITDANTGLGLKQWKINQWRNYQFRCDFGTGRTQLRPILYNTINSIVWSDPNHITINPWAQPLMNVSVAVGSLYCIESHIVTVNTNWTTNPDSTSTFVIVSGGIWNVSQGTTAAPFFSLNYYDVLADQWYGKTTTAGLKTAVFLAASDLSMERLTEAGGVIITGTATSGGARALFDTGLSMTPMQYANFELRIVGGTGLGQARSILSNTATKFNVVKDWDTNPDLTSVYEVWRDCGKIWLVGGGDAGMLQYSTKADQWTTGKQLDDGQCNQFAAIRSGQDPFALTSITRVSGGISVLNATPTAGGSAYNVNDILTITTGGTLGTARVLTVDATGAVLTVALETCGKTYTTGATKATTVVPAGGTLCTLNITTISEIANVVTPIAHNFAIGDTVTISGATLAGYNGAQTVLGVATTLAFDYALASTYVSPAVAVASPSTVQVVDCTKNWAVNEHAGKIVQLCNNAILATGGQARRIVSNTATTLVWTLAATAPVNGTYRYVIEDIKPFGTERMPMGIVGLGTEGFATGGSATTLIDTTKNWETNYWSRTVNRKVRIVEGTGVGNEIAITSNTATTLTYASQAFTPDTTTRYVIMDTFGTATAGTTVLLTDAGQNWGVNQWIGKRVRFLSGTSQGNEYTITANAATTLTYAAGTAPDTSTAYAILESSPRSYGLHLDNIIGSTDTTINNKYMYSFNGSATVELSRYDITDEHWDLMSYFPQFETLTTGAMYVYDGVDRIYINLSTTWGMSGRIAYYDLTKNIIVNSSVVPYGHSTNVSGNRMEIIQTADGLKYLYVMRESAQEMWRTLLFW